MAAGSSSRDARPSQYLLKIRSYEILSDLTDRYESNAFKVGNYNWRLVFHPNGKRTNKGKNKGKNDKIYISLSLALDGTQIPGDDWNVLVNFSFYVFNHRTNKYVTFSGSKGKERQFDRNHLEHGCDEFLSIEDFKLNSNGYLQADSCTFGVDVLVIQPSRIMEVVSATPSLDSFTWTISDFERSRSKLVLHSIDFLRGERKWRMKLYAPGSEHVPNHVSIYLTIYDNKEKSRGSVYGKFKFTLIDQLRNSHRHHRRVNGKVDDGLDCPEFLTNEEFENRDNGYILNDTVKVKVEFLGIYEVKMESI